MCCVTFQIIHQTLVKKASMMNDVHHVQILYSAWAILNDAYVPIAASTTSTQTDPPPTTPRLESCTQTPARAAAREGSAQTVSPPLRAAGCQTALPECRDNVSQTECRSGPGLVSEQAVQTDGPTVPLRPPWALRLVRGALPPPAERPAEPRRFHGRRLLRRGYEAAPPEIPLSAVPGGGDGDGGPPSPAPPADPRLELPRQQCGSEPGGRVGRRRTRTESDTGSICSPVGQTGRRSRSGSSGGEGDPPGPAPAVAPAPVPAPAPVNRDPRIRTPSAESVSAGPGLMSHPSPPRLPSLNADDQKVPLVFDSSLTAMLDTSYSFLPAPPPELLGGGGALLQAQH
ncbi:hypothetical protein FJT64_018330 [Amphibalanus amphitrite]|uniref:Uncharacterized protein n=1 Tax=Amphibalanus amphitrite TaxID=1232801 RepID=A0A6A4WY63_AMPAM|nr:hypothetical protein FJT64_018330 [Amphibalanus amphitrite]